MTTAAARQRLAASARPVRLKERHYAAPVAGPQSRLRRWDGDSSRPTRSKARTARHRAPVQSPKSLRPFGVSRAEPPSWRPWRPGRRRHGGARKERPPAYRALDETRRCRRGNGSRRCAAGAYRWRFGDSGSFGSEVLGRSRIMTTLSPDPVDKPVDELRLTRFANRN